MSDVIASLVWRVGCFVEELDLGENVGFSSTVLTCGSVLAHAGDGCTALLCVDLVNRARGTRSILQHFDPVCIFCMGRFG